MKQHTKYIIRERHHRYNDEYIEDFGQGNIKHVFDNLDEAKSQCKVWERLEYRKNLNGIALFIGNSNQEDDVRMRQLIAYLQELFGDEIEIENIDRNLKLPRELNNDEIDKLREIVGFKFFELVKFEKEINFYVAVLNLEMFSEQEYLSRYFQTEIIEKFYNSKQEAIERIIYYLDDIDVPKIKGELEELSNTPQILKSVIQSHKNLSYEDKQIKFENGMATGLFEIHDLLKKKPILIEKKSLDQIKEEKTE